MRIWSFGSVVALVFALASCGNDPVVVKPDAAGNGQGDGATRDTVQRDARADGPGIDAVTAVDATTDTGSDSASGSDAGGAEAGPSCADGIKNGDETDKDCGAGCGPCAVGQMCKKAGDCVSGACGTGGTCLACGVASDCPGTDTECAKRTCVAGVCGTEKTAAGTALATQVKGDCIVRQCDGNGAIVSAHLDTDLPDDSNPCTGDVCTAGVPSNPPLPISTTCGGNRLCDGAGSCVGCVVAADCPGTDTECRTRTCSDNKCAFVYKPEGSVVMSQASGDCKVNQCDGRGNLRTVASDTDIPDDMNLCTLDQCGGGTPSHAPTALRSACGTGRICNGAGTCVECLTAATCPGSDNACQTRTCINGACGLGLVAAGTPIAAQVAGDCKVNRCDGQGAVVAANDDNDRPDDGNACTRNECVGGVPMHPPVSMGASCGGGNQCDGAGHCVACLGPSDCPGSDTECARRTCVQNQCGVSFTAGGTPLMMQSVGDCKKVQCDGQGRSVAVVDDTDKPIDGNTCTDDVCTNGTPSNPPYASGRQCAAAGMLCDGAGHCVGCLTKADCPGDDNECQTRTCTSHVCGFSWTAPGFVLATQVAGDCRQRECDGGGHVVSAPLDSDKPNDNKTCTVDDCAAGMPTFTPLPAATACGAQSLCDAVGNCVGCLMDSDCFVGTDNNECRTKKCNNNTCSWDYQPVNTLLSAPAQTAGDCKQLRCDATGNIIDVADNNDRPVDNNECTADACPIANATDPNPALAAGALCTQSPGMKVCNGAKVCVECVTAADCGRDTFCKTYACNQGVCAAPTPINVGMSVPGAQNAGDCQVVQCGANGEPTSVADNNDKPADVDACNLMVCAAGVPTPSFAPVQTQCGAGNSICDGAGSCVGCVMDSDCPVGANECQVRVCLPNNSCGFTLLDGTLMAAQTAGDCKQGWCMAGVPTQLADGTDPFDDDNECTQNICNGDTPTNPTEPTGTLCATGFCQTSACVACIQNSDCGVTDECTARTCVNNACVTTYTPANVALATQTAGDCQERQCTVNHSVTSVTNNADTPADDGNSCTGDICDNGVVSHPSKAFGTACTQNGGNRCDGAVASPSCLPTFMVAKVGDGASALSSAAAAVFVEERIRPTGVAGDVLGGTIAATFSLPIASSGSQLALTMSGSASSEGGLSRSADGKYVSLVGYAAAPGTANVATASYFARVVGRLDRIGTVDSTTSFSSAGQAFVGNNVRAATSSDGSGFWVSGAGNTNTGGVWYIPFGQSAGTQITGQMSNNPSNARVCHVASAQLFCSSNNAPVGVMGVGTGLPVTQSTAALLTGFPSSGSPSPFSFAFFDADANIPGNDLLYVADDRTSTNGGVQKWTYDMAMAKWVLSSTLNILAAGSTTSFVGARGLAAYRIASGVVLIVTTTDNRIVFLGDYASPALPGAVAAPTNTAFRGVALSPQ